MRNRILTVATLVMAVAMLAGCSSTKYVARKNTLVNDIGPTKCGTNSCAEKAKDWDRIAKMTNEEICQLLGCEGKERIITKEIVKEVPVEKIVTREVIKEVPVEKEVRKPYLVLPGVFFDFDKDTLKAIGKAELDKAVADLSGQGNPFLSVSGHTDSIGTDKYNMNLSARRAATVKKYMVSKGYEAEKIDTQAFGESKPIASNKTKEGRAQNRRVELDIVIK